jgi:hypothetical protein
MDLSGIEPGGAALFLVRACSGLSCMGCRHGDARRPSSTHTRTHGQDLLYLRGEFSRLT